MQMCLGAIGMSSTDFWRLTPLEFWEMHEGYRLANDPGTNDDEPLDKDDLREMLKADRKRCADPDYRKREKKITKRLRRSYVGKT